MYQLMITLAGPIVWAAHFSLMYAAQTLACVGAFGVSPAVFSHTASALTVLTVCALLATIGYQLVVARRQAGAVPSQMFLRNLQVMLAGLSLLAVAWGTFPAVALPTEPCP